MKIASIALMMVVLLGVQSTGEIKPIATIEANYNFIETDQLGYLYVVGDYKVTKYDKQGKLMFVYESFRNGTISQIDVTNPLKSIVFHEEFMEVVVLDKTLSELTRYNLQQYNFDLVTAIAYARNEELWLYDASSFRLVMIDNNGVVIQNSEVFNVLFEESLNPSTLKFFENSLYVLDENKSIYIFDAFGGYLKRVVLKDVVSFQLFQDQIVYWNGTQLLIYDDKNLTQNAIEVPKLKGIDNVMVQKDRMYIALPGFIHIYQY